MTCGTYDVSTWEKSIMQGSKRIARTILALMVLAAVSQPIARADEPGLSPMQTGSQYGLSPMQTTTDGSVDIVDESLKIQQNVAPQLGAGYGNQQLGMNNGMLQGSAQMNQMTMGQANQMAQMQLRMQAQGMGMGNGMNIGMNNGYGMSPMMQPQMNGFGMQNMMHQHPGNCMNCYREQMAQQQHDEGQALKRTVGALGAAAVMGVFLQNGGIGGALRSMGWDNTRHIRGPAVWQ